MMVKPPQPKARTTPEVIPGKGELPTWDGPPLEKASTDHPLDGWASRGHEAATNERHDLVTSRDHESRTSEGQDGDTSESRDVEPARRPAGAKSRRRTAMTPSAAEAVAWTVRWDPDESLDVDEWVLGLRRELGGRAKVDKSEIVRALIAMARTRADVRRSLIATLKRSARP